MAIQGENIKRIIYALVEDTKDLITLSEYNNILDECLKQLNKI